jgi:hypothetical protein
MVEPLFISLINKIISSVKLNKIKGSKAMHSETLHK